MKIRVIFWPESSALWVFIYFDSERMRPLNTQVPPPPPPGVLVSEIDCRMALPLTDLTIRSAI